MFKFLKSALFVKASKELEKEVKKDLEEPGEEIDINSVIRRNARNGVRPDSRVRGEQPRTDI